MCLRRRSVEEEYLPVIKRCGIGSNGFEYLGSCASVWYVRGMWYVVL